MQPILEAKQLKKVYKIYNPREGFKGHVKNLFNRKYMNVEAVKGIDLSINKGEIVGYIGLNGAGKSTTIKMLTGIIKPTSGKVTICGLDPYENRRKVSRDISVVFGQKTHLWADLPAKDSFELIKAMYDISDEDYNERINWLKSYFNFEDILNQQVRKLSLGQKMMCEIAVCLIYNPKILFLDEPTIGLDVLIKSKVIDLIKEMNNAYDTTVIVTSHDLKDIEELCNRIIMIDSGKIIYNGSLDDIYQEYTETNDIQFYAKTILKDEYFKDIKGKYTFTLNENVISIKYNIKNDNVTTVISDVIACYNDFYDMSIKNENLEKIVKKIYK